MVLNSYIVPFSDFLDQLLTEPIDKDATELPSPEMLKRKVILKVSIAQKFKRLFYIHLYEIILYHTLHTVIGIECN